MACTGCKKKTVLPQNDEKSFINESGFKLRNTGVHQLNFGSGLMISNDNMTIDLAIEFLKENPNRISLFAEFPENWKELISKDASTDNKKKVTMSK